MQMKKISDPAPKMGHFQLHNAMKRALVESGLLPADMSTWPTTPRGLVDQVRGNLDRRFAGAKGESES